MTLYQYSKLQRLLGKLEGLGQALVTDDDERVYDEVLSELDTVIEEIREGEKWAWEESNRWS